MRKYECFFIVNPELSEEAMTAVGDKLKGIVTAHDGAVVSYVPWGKKKLAYPIKKSDYGHYILMEFASGPELVTELERNMRLDERVLKFITVKLEDQYEPETAVETPDEAETGEQEAPEEEVPEEEASEPEAVEPEVAAEETEKAEE